ncbi:MULTISPECIES: hypothetical protein [Pseudomonas]|uniref:Uncharacterized protein n=2 Tax=Pseudomonas TaxID=286 RepID=A0A449IER4_PSEFR|nr:MULTISPECIES: hypothetical protein [Pseudomonas]MQT76401.1 hypothetical protein [Pseudomonas helleri]VFB17951.1 Uncharacterised protein [Pseudomonas fragi]
MSDLLRETLQRIKLEDEADARKFANTDFDMVPEEYWYQLSRPSIDAGHAAFLIANISPKAKEDSLSHKKRSLLADARMLVETCQVENMSAPEWLRWAFEHSDSPPGLTKEKERIERVLLAFDRNPGKQQKAELDELHQALKREQAKNQELSRRLENTECALDAAQQGEAEARSEYENAEHAHDVTLRELRETIESELLPPLNSDLAKARSEIEQLKLDIDKAKERASYRLLTAALLSLLEEPGRQSGMKQAGIKKTILERFSTWPGLKIRTLDDMFAEANDAAKEAGTAS